jgi:tRNA 2-thiouridine synthesizing protein A
MTIETPASILDLRGLNCPLPALRTLKALRTATPGTELAVQCTDPMSAIDIPLCLVESGHELLGQTEDGGVLTFRVRRGAASDGSQETAAS